MLEPRLPAALFYNLLLSARVPGAQITERRARGSRENPSGRSEKPTVSLGHDRVLLDRDLVRVADRVPDHQVAVVDRRAGGVLREALARGRLVRIVATGVELVAVELGDPQVVLGERRVVERLEVRAHVGVDQVDRLECVGGRLAESIRARGAFHRPVPIRCRVRVAEVLRAEQGFVRLPGVPEGVRRAGAGVLLDQGGSTGRRSRGPAPPRERSPGGAPDGLRRNGVGPGDSPGSCAWTGPPDGCPAASRPHRAS